MAASQPGVDTPPTRRCSTTRAATAATVYADGVGDAERRARAVDVRDQGERERRPGGVLDDVEDERRAGVALGVEAPQGEQVGREPRQPERHRREHVGRVLGRLGVERAPLEQRGHERHGRQDEDRGRRDDAGQHQPQPLAEPVAEAPEVAAVPRRRQRRARTSS